MTTIIPQFQHFKDGQRNKFVHYIKFLVKYYKCIGPNIDYRLNAPNVGRTPKPVEEWFGSWGPYNDFFPERNIITTLRWCLYGITAY